MHGKFVIVRETLKKNSKLLNLILFTVHVPDHLKYTCVNSSLNTTK